MPPPQPRTGERLRVNKKLISNSFWPTKTGPKGNASLQTHLFSLDPWAIIDQAIKTTCPATARQEALQVGQSNPFYVVIE